MAAGPKEQKSRQSVVAIDKFRLDEEWVNQPNLYLEWADKLAEAKEEHEEAKRLLSVAENEVEEDVRLRPEKYNIKVPIRESAVKMAVRLHDDVVNARKDLNASRADVGMLENMVTAIGSHRKKALEDLVSLQLAGYFAEPRARRGEDREAAQEIEKQAVRKGAAQRRRSAD